MGRMTTAATAPEASITRFALPSSLRSTLLASM